MVGDRKLRSRLTLACLLAVLTMTATACAGADKTDPTASSAAPAVVITTATGPFGTYLVNGTGRAVYMYDADPEGGSECYDSCAAQWPPVPAATAGSGVTASDLTSSTRSDDTVQAVYDNHALYYYSGDTAAGQTSGQAFDLAGGGIFYLLTPGGSPLSSAPTPSSGAAPSSSVGG